MEAVLIAGIAFGFGLVVFAVLLLRFPEETRALVVRTESVSLNSKGLAVRFFREAINEKEHRTVPRRQLEPAISAISGGRVLWIDDAPANNIREVQALRALGVDVDMVTSNREAQDLAEAFDYDLILSDIDREKRPTESGLQLPELLREVGQNVPLAFYVGRAEGEETDDGVPVFSKPSELLAFIAKTLGESGKADAR